MATSTRFTPLMKDYIEQLNQIDDSLSLRLLSGNGVPSNTVGNDGNGYLRLDKPYLGALYLKSVGAWGIADNSYTLASLPTASSTYAGAVATVVDSTYAPIGKEFMCVSYDGGTTYYWRPVDGVWKVLKSTIITDSATAGPISSSIVTAYNVSLPNRADMIVPGMDIALLGQIIATGTTNTKGMDIVALGLSGTGGNSQVLTTVSLSNAQLSGTCQALIHVTSQTAGYSHPSTAWYNSPATSAVTTFSGTWAGLAINYRKSAADSSQTAQLAAREITFIYP